MNESTKQEIKNTQKTKEKKLMRGEYLKIEGFDGLFRYIETRGDIVSCVTPSGTLAGFHITRVRRIS